MMKFLLIFVIITLCSCSNNTKKPFGAETYKFNDFDNLSNEGPVLEEHHIENVPPTADKTYVEKGPTRDENSLKKIEPTAESDFFSSYDGVPIYQPERRD